MLARCVAAALALSASAAWATKLVIVPIDSRPVTGQFPQMIAKVAGIDVDLPPPTFLGRYLQPGEPASIGSWLLAQDYTDCAGVVIAADMLAYGGLIASRAPDTSAEQAQRNLQQISALRRAHPTVPIYAYVALMRTAPTATADTRSWRMQMARYAELEERIERTGETALREKLRELRSQIPDREFKRYYAARARNMEVYKALIRLVKEGTINYLVIGADDSQEYGPHYRETKELRKYVREREIDGLVYICDGVDQHANVLTSRALLRHFNWTPKVAYVLSDPQAADKPANYESLPLSISIRDQIIAAGARPALGGAFDFTVYVNTKGADDILFTSFAAALTNDLSAGGNVAVADINFDRTGTGDQRLVDVIWGQQHIEDMLGFAGWNTAGNTIGTAIPQATVYMLAKRVFEKTLVRELAHREFLFHRLANDYAYCKVIRPMAYSMMEEHPDGSREEASGGALQLLESWVGTNAPIVIERYFKRYFEGHTFRVEESDYTITSIKDVKVTLPWPRAFEAKIVFKLNAESATKPQAIGR
jgi:hypothetical protein